MSTLPWNAVRHVSVGTWLQGELELRLGRRVDGLILPEVRLREKIEREGERWTL